MSEITSVMYILIIFGKKGAKLKYFSSNNYKTKGNTWPLNTNIEGMTYLCLFLMITFFYKVMLIAFWSPVIKSSSLLLFFSLKGNTLLSVMSQVVVKGF